jgi:hypothetical protein
MHRAAVVQQACARKSAEKSVRCPGRLTLLKTV